MNRFNAGGKVLKAGGYDVPGPLAFLQGTMQVLLQTVFGVFDHKIDTFFPISRKFRQGVIRGHSSEAVENAEAGCPLERN